MTSEIVENEMSQTHIICEGLTKMFNNKVGISNIDLDLEFQGLGLLGPNGSGKTTFIKMLLGIISPTSGSIALNVAREDIRVVSDQPMLPTEMTIDEWIYTVESMHGKLVRDIDIQTDLGLEGDWKIKNLSAGQVRKAALLPAFYGKPKLIILDEPSNYLDIATREYILMLLKKHCEETNASVILSSHNIEEIRLFASHVLLLKEGRLMNNVYLDNQLPEFFSISASDLDKLSTELVKNGVLHTREITIQGEILKTAPSLSVWNALKSYMSEGGLIYSFKAIDLLEKMIQDLAK